jgi:hypothetical protein
MHRQQSDQMTRSPKHAGLILCAVVLAAFAYLILSQKDASTEQTPDDEAYAMPAPNLPPISGSIPEYASYLLEDRAWKVDCYSIGLVSVALESAHRFRKRDGSFLTHKEFCDLYI